MLHSHLATSSFISRCIRILIADYADLDTTNHSMTAAWSLQSRVLQVLRSYEHLLTNLQLYESMALGGGQLDLGLLLGGRASTAVLDNITVSDVLLGFERRSEVLEIQLAKDDVYEGGGGLLDEGSGGLL